MHTFSIHRRERRKKSAIPEGALLLKHFKLRITTHLGTESTEDDEGTLETWQFAAAASFKADDGTALKVLGICRAFIGAIEFTVGTDEGTVNRMLFPNRTWVVAELAAVTWWLSALWEPEVCVIFEGCNKVEPAVDGLVCTSAVGVVLLRCKPLYTPGERNKEHQHCILWLYPMCTSMYACQSHGAMQSLCPHLRLEGRHSPRSQAPHHPSSWIPSAVLTSSKQKQQIVH